jgi:hypothetical protein
MGTGIMGAIPISFRFGDRWWYSKEDEQKCKEAFIKHAPKNVLDFYDEELHEITDSKQKKVMVTYYKIKSEILLPNFKDFFYDFHNLIGAKLWPKNERKFNDEYDAIVAANDLDKFVEYFDDDTGCEPSIFSDFAPAYITSKNLYVYNGSYKTIMEETSSLRHMERLLWAAMDNPLAKVMRIGMSL